MPCIRTTLPLWPFTSEERFNFYSSRMIEEVWLIPPLSLEYNDSNILNKDNIDRRDGFPLGSLPLPESCHRCKEWEIRCYSRFNFPEATSLIFFDEKNSLTCCDTSTFEYARINSSSEKQTTYSTCSLDSHSACSMDTLRTKTASLTSKGSYSSTLLGLTSIGKLPGHCHFNQDISDQSNINTAIQQSAASSCVPSISYMLDSSMQSVWRFRFEFPFSFLNFSFDFGSLMNDDIIQAWLEQIVMHCLFHEFPNRFVIWALPTLSHNSYHLNKVMQNRFSFQWKPFFEWKRDSHGILGAWHWSKASFSGSFPSSLQICPSQWCLCDSLLNQQSCRSPQFTSSHFFSFPLVGCYPHVVSTSSFSSEDPIILFMALINGSICPLYRIHEKSPEVCNKKDSSDLSARLSDDNMISYDEWAVDVISELHRIVEILSQDTHPFSSYKLYCLPDHVIIPTLGGKAVGYGVSSIEKCHNMTKSRKVEEPLDHGEIACSNRNFCRDSRVFTKDGKLLLGAQNSSNQSVENIDHQGLVVIFAFPGHHDIKYTQVLPNFMQESHKIPPPNCLGLYVRCVSMQRAIEYLLANDPHILQNIFPVSTSFDKEQISRKVTLGMSSKKRSSCKKVTATSARALSPQLLRRTIVNSILEMVSYSTNNEFIHQVTHLLQQAAGYTKDLTLLNASFSNLKNEPHKTKLFQGDLFIEKSSDPSPTADSNDSANNEYFVEGNTMPFSKEYLSILSERALLQMEDL